MWYLPCFRYVDFSQCYFFPFFQWPWHLWVSNPALSLSLITVLMWCSSGPCFPNSISLQKIWGQGRCFYWHDNGSEMSHKHEAVQLALLVTAPFLLSLLFPTKAIGLRVKLAWELTWMSSTICFTGDIFVKTVSAEFSWNFQILIRSRWVAKGI